MPCEKSKEKKEHVVSKAQAGFFGAVAGGKSTKKTTMTRAQARHHLRGEKIKGLPKRKSKRSRKTLLT